MLTKFPVGEERRAIGQVSIDEPARIRVAYETPEKIKNLRVKFWGSQDRCVSRDIPAANSVVVELPNDAVSIGAKTYTLHAVFNNDQEKIISKGRVWLNATN